ncbi:MAG: hypothetical protein RDV48_13720 [Candidatus Eremiobacteraeota bacterium]|nr:hypothetical protein [Candidatus Eremiobacteraeota bacterium]
MNKTFLSIVLCLFFTVAFPMPGTASPSRQKDIDDIIVVVFRHEIKEFTSWKEVKVFFLSLHGRDPRDSIMNRFQGNRPPVKKVSESSTRDVKALYQIYDKETGENGVIFDIDSLRFTSASRAEVGGGYLKDGLAAAHGIFYMLKKRGRWVIEKYNVNCVASRPIFNSLRHSSKQVSLQGHLILSPIDTQFPGLAMDKPRFHCSSFSIIR